MLKSETLFKILLYLSIPFVIWVLIKFDFFRLQSLQFNYGWLTVSLVFLWAGFVFSAISWKIALKYHKISISSAIAIKSHGLSVFAKYIPGKIWVILGRASYISKKKYDLKSTSFISLKEQLLYILIGLAISIYPTYHYFNLNYITLLLVLTTILFALILFYQRAHDLGEIILSKILKKKFDLPRLESMLAGKLSLSILLYWGLWIFGFYFLIKACLPESEILYAFAFPLSVSYGVLAIIMPGGVGVREGIMVAFLTQAGAELDSAVTLSVISRLWFISGEVFFFLLALGLQLGSKKNHDL